MKNRLLMHLSSLHEITPESARSQIQALSDLEGGTFRPITCDTAEPLREKFNPDDISEPVRWVSQAGAWFQFKRLKPYRVEGWIRNHHFPKIWTTERKGGPLVPVTPKFPEPLFLTTWTVWIDWRAVKGTGTEVLRNFLIDMFMISKSEYGFLTSESDQRAKNFSSVRSESPVTKGDYIITEKFLGDDPAEGIPGLYWINAFGPIYSRWLGQGLKSIPAEVEELTGGSHLIRYCETPEDCQSDDVLFRQAASKALLGEEKFFDIAQPNRRVMSPFRKSQV
jgi:hypothetical protein